MSAAHPGFKNVQNSIMRREGVSKKRAGAILAAATRRAGPAARKRNPRLNRVKGYRKGGKVRGYARGGMVCGKRAVRGKMNPAEYTEHRRDGETTREYNGD